MYINGLGTRNIGELQAATSRKASNINSFEDNMQKAVETWKAITKTGSGADASGGVEDSCCEQCYINSQIINRMMTRSLFMQSVPSSLGMMGLSAYGGGSSALSAYGNTLGLLGSSIFGNIQI